MHVWFPVKKSLFPIAGISYFNTTVTSLILVFTIYLIFYAITLCLIMFICPFVGPLIWTNKILYLVYCISRKFVETEYTYYSWCMTSTDIVKWRKTNDCENFEKSGVVEKRGRRKRNPCPMRLWTEIVIKWRKKHTTPPGQSKNLIEKSSNHIIRNYYQHRYCACVNWYHYHTR